jgi:tetratricopeptide (TPR) repeat protein
VSKALEKELKAPDQFVSFWSQVGSGLGKRRTSILVVFVATFTAVAGIVGVRHLMDGRAATSSRDLARIHAIASAALLPEKGDAPKLEDDLPHFKTDKERQQAAIKAADDFLAAHAGSSLASSARLLKARVLMASGQPSEALKVYQELEGAVDEHLRFLVQEGKAYALEELGQIDQAIGVLDGLAEGATKAGNFHRDRALFTKARLLAGKGHKKDAEKVLKDVLAEAPTTPLKEEISERLALLDDGTGPKAEAPAAAKAEAPAGTKAEGK